MAKVPSNDGLDWGLFPTAAELPNVSGSSTQNADLVVGARAYVADDGAYVCAVPTVNGATWQTAGTGTDAGDVTYTPTTPGDWPNPDPTDVQTGLDSLASQVAGLGGGAAIVGPFTCTTAVGPVFCTYGASISGFVAPRAGSITALSGVLSAAPADDVIDVTVQVGISPELTMQFAIGDDGEYVTAAAGTHAVAAGDLVLVFAEGGASLSNTPTLTCTFEFTPS